MKPKKLVIPLILMIILTACSDGTGFLGMGPTQTPTPTMTPTSTPAPTPTPTPTVGDLLEDAWAAYDEGDLKTTSEITSAALLREPENAEALALDAFCMMEDHLDKAMLKLEDAKLLGFTNPALIETLEDYYIEQISAYYDESLYGSWDPDDILSAVENVHLYLDKLESLIPNYPRLDFLFFGFYERGDDGNLSIANSSQEAYELFSIGDDYWGDDDLENAIIYYGKAIETDPNFGLAYVYLGDTYYKGDDYYTAIDYYLQGLEADPLLLQGYSFSSHLYSKLFFLQSAREYSVYALALDVEYESPLIYLGNIYDIQEQYIDNSYYSSFNFVVDYPLDMTFEIDYYDNYIYIYSYSTTIDANSWVYDLNHIDEEIFSEDDSSFISGFLESIYENNPTVEYIFDQPNTFSLGQDDLIYQIMYVDEISDGTKDSSLIFSVTCNESQIVYLITLHDQTVDESSAWLNTTLDSFRCLDN